MRAAVPFVLVIALSACASAPPRLATRPVHSTLPAEDWGVTEREDEMDFTIPAFNPFTSKDPTEQIDALYRGVDRKGAKTSISPGSAKRFADIEALAASLPSDAAMVGHQPPIARDTMTRVAEERRNVRVPAWIYAIKYEADQDWHVILGTDPADRTPTFFNAEVSGLPARNTPAFKKLRKVRSDLATIFDFDLPGGSGYFAYAQPVPVVVEGSLFFDIDHPAGVVGPAGMRPATAWEIHPITKLSAQ